MQSPGPELLHPQYLPFTREQVLEHFVPVGAADTDRKRFLTHFDKSLKKLWAFEADPPTAPAKIRSATWEARQLEKDERFWVVAALLGIYYADDARTRAQRFGELLSLAFSDSSAHAGADEWTSRLEGPLHLYFEANLPSPESYRHWLRDHVDERTLIPHLIEAAETSRLEGPTKVDALLIAPESQTAVFFEAKVLSDADTKISYDVARNQIARTIDVMLDSPTVATEQYDRLHEHLRQRTPETSYYVLLTPEIFRKQPKTRLYGWLLDGYREDPKLLAEHLPHRKGIDWPAVAERLGWLTFKDCKRVSPEVCAWLPAADEPATP